MSFSPETDALRRKLLIDHPERVSIRAFNLMAERCAKFERHRNYWKELAELNALEALYEPWFPIGESLPPFEVDVELRLQSGETYVGYRLRRKDGSVRWRILPHAHPPGDVTHWRPRVRRTEVAKSPSFKRAAS